jgi:hypothetical protein
MFQKLSAVLVIAVGLLAASALPARANFIGPATATANCQGYTVTVVAYELQPNQMYQINFSFTITCGGGAPMTVPGSIIFTSPSAPAAASARLSRRAELSEACLAIAT